MKEITDKNYALAHEVDNAVIQCMCRKLFKEIKEATLNYVNEKIEESTYNNEILDFSPIMLPMEHDSDKIVEEYGEDVKDIFKYQGLPTNLNKVLKIGSQKGCKRFVYLIEEERTLVDLWYLFKLFEEKDVVVCIDFDNNKLYWQAKPETKSKTKKNIL